MVNLVGADRNAAVTEITTLYNGGDQKSISEHATHRGGWATTAEDASGSTHASRVQKSEATVGSGSQVLGFLRDP